MKSIGIIGFGNMGEAMVQGIQKNQPKLKINIIEKVAARRDVAVQQYSAQDLTLDYAGFMQASDLVVLAIKPQDIHQLLEILHPHTLNKPIISILAGITLGYFQKASQALEIARFMPSLAASVGKAVVGISFSTAAGEQFRSDALAIAASMGSGFEIPEQLMPAIVGISGSGLAFVFEFINALAMGATRTGLPYATSLKIALDVLDGAVATLRANGVHPSDMTSRVCSPAGTTIEGIMALEKHSFTASVMEAVSAAAHRARELES